MIQQPFTASKIFGDRKLYKRVHGIQKDCVVGENIFEFAIPYEHCKITSIELIGAINCDTLDFRVMTITDVELNQFGFTVNVSKDFYCHRSEFDADLYKGLKLKITYNAQNAGKIGINFILNEVK